MGSAGGSTNSAAATPTTSMNAGTMRDIGAETTTAVTTRGCIPKQLLRRLLGRPMRNQEEGDEIVEDILEAARYDRIEAWQRNTKRGQRGRSRRGRTGEQGRRQDAAGRFVGGGEGDGASNGAGGKGRARGPLVEGARSSRT